MRPRLAIIAVAAAAALASAEAAAARRATVVLIPVDRNAGSAASRYTEYLEAAISKRSSYTLREASSVLGDTTPTAALEARKRVINAVNEGKKLYANGQFDEAESSLRTALIDIDNAAAAMERCGEYCDALAYLSGAQLMKGDEAGAREVLKTLLSIEKTYKFDAAIFGKNLMMLVRDVQKKLGEEGLVNVTVQTNPPGGKIFVDGQYKGYSPLTIERMPTGRHLLRVERAGAVTFGQLVDVAATEETQIKAKLTPTPEYTALESVLDKIADEIDRGENHTELMRLGNRLKVDRAIVGLVRTNEQRVTLDCILVDFAARKKLVRMNRSFQGEEFGELQREVERFGNVLLSEGDNPTKVKKSSDPLDNHSGVEDWDEEGSGTKSDQNKPEKPKENKKKKNDLESETGTGDW